MRVVCMGGDCHESSELFRLFPVRSTSPPNERWAANRAHLLERGISPVTVMDFQLGYSPADLTSPLIEYLDQVGRISDDEGKRGGLRGDRSLAPCLAAHALKVVRILFHWDQVERPRRQTGG